MCTCVCVCVGQGGTMHVSLYALRIISLDRILLFINIFFFLYCSCVFLKGTFLFIFTYLYFVILLFDCCVLLLCFSKGDIALYLYLLLIRRLLCVAAVFL